RIDYVKELNQEQLRVVLEGDDACLVLAGAGSGKTRTLTYRVAYLLEQGVDPASILLLTFTNKAAKEMLMRVESLVGQMGRGITGGTFHSVASRMLRVFANRLDYHSQFSILDSEDSRDLIKAVMKDLSIDPKARRFPSASVVLDIISFARNTQTSIEASLEIKHPNFYAFSGDIEEIARQYQLRKKSSQAMDFDDLLTNLALLQTDPQVGEMLAGRFQYVLVDEYQDTNAMQAKLVKGFARVHENILVVGDDAQSIYAFRGADVKNILRFPDEWPDSKMFKLVTNYRSTPQILELANESLKNNQQQFEKELVGVRSKGDKPHLVPCASAGQEAQYVAEQILMLRQEGTSLRNIAVLFRSSAHSQALEFELMKRDLPYEYRGGQKFFERAHIKDVLAFLRVANNVRDEVAWLRVLGLQSGIGAATASALANQLKEYVEFDQVMKVGMLPALSTRAQTGWQGFLMIAERMQVLGSAPAMMIRGICKSPYQDYLEREYPNWRDRLEDLEQLALFAENYTELTPFLSDISLYDEVAAKREEAEAQKDPPAGGERLILSTIHQAKGLEWDSVFIIHLADNAFPNRRALAEEDGLEEERRLFYVAVTRARRKLFLTYPLTFGYDSLMFNQPSTFIDEVSPRLFDRVELRSSGLQRLKSSTVWRTLEDEGFEEPGIDINEL
ncbi:ATP-dependent helicase, partial [Candidatus Uhrbacteria bacterium]|nr:ATP-dependent helicase [Candidatus Uhrbacteria bacterium]